MIRELKYKGVSLEEIVERAKNGFSKLVNGSDVKLVGIELHFLVDEETQLKVGMFADGYNPSEFEENDEEG